MGEVGEVGGVGGVGGVGEVDEVGEVGGVGGVGEVGKEGNSKLAIQNAKEGNSKLAIQNAKRVIPIRYEGEPNIFTLSEPEVLLDKEFIFRVIALLSAASHLIGISKIFSRSQTCSFAEIQPTLREAAPRLHPKSLSRECSDSCGIGILPVPAEQARRLPYKACRKLD